MAIRHPLLTTATALGLFISGSAYSANAEIPAEVLAKLEALSARVNQLEAQLANAQPQYQAASPNSALAQKVVALEQKVNAQEEAQLKLPTVKADTKGFTIASQDEEFALRVGAFLQNDGRFFQSGIKGQHAYSGDTADQQLAADIATRSATDTFLVRRARAIFDFSWGQIYSARIAAEFGGGSTSLADGYINAKFHEAAQLRVGKFQGPIGLERLQSSSSTKFTELALASNFLPVRDVGVQLSGAFFDKRLDYAVAYTNGADDGSGADNDTNNDKEVSARIRISPFADQKDSAFNKLSFGLGVSKADAKGSNGSTLLRAYKTPGQENFFNYRSDSGVNNTVLADGDRTRLVPQFEYYYGPWALFGEYVKEKQDVARIYGAGFLDKRSAKLDHEGWQITGSYVLTGEKNSNGLITPNRPFAAGSDGWGAFELAVRLSEQTLDKDTFRDSTGSLVGANSFAQATRSAQKAENWGVALHWYPVRNLRFTADYQDTDFTWGGGGTAANPKDREGERILTARASLAF